MGACLKTLLGVPCGGTLVIFVFPFYVGVHCVMTYKNTIFQITLKDSIFEAVDYIILCFFARMEGKRRNMERRQVLKFIRKVKKRCGYCLSVT